MVDRLYRYLSKAERKSNTWGNKSLIYRGLTNMSQPSLSPLFRAMACPLLAPSRCVCDINSVFSIFMYLWFHQLNKLFLSYHTPPTWVRWAAPMSVLCKTRWDRTPDNNWSSGAAFSRLVSWNIRYDTPQWSNDDNTPTIIKSPWHLLGNLVKWIIIFLYSQMQISMECDIYSQDYVSGQRGHWCTWRNENIIWDVREAR